jgi:hypothetical protein
VGARFPAPVQSGHGTQAASYKMGTGFFPRIKRPVRGVDHSPPSSAENKERVRLYLYNSSGSSWLVLRLTLFLPVALLGTTHKGLVSDNFKILK